MSNQNPAGNEAQKPNPQSDQKPAQQNQGDGQQTTPKPDQQQQK